jgi:hypothetical protein
MKHMVLKALFDYTDFVVDEAATLFTAAGHILCGWISNVAERMEL